MLPMLCYGGLMDGAWLGVQVSIGLLFWQFANDIITVDEAKRYHLTHLDR